MTIPPFLRSRRLTTRAAGFIATSTSGASPGVWMSVEEKLIWNPLTPGRVPAGARISAGKSGKVARSLPNRAAVFVNWLPVICMPSPESPQNRTTAWSIVSFRFWLGGTSVLVAMDLETSLGSDSNPGVYRPWTRAENGGMAATPVAWMSLTGMAAVPARGPAVDASEAYIFNTYMKRRLVQAGGSLA